MAERTCSIEGCERRAAKRGWCATHYQRWRRHGDPLGGGRARASHGFRSICEVAGCDEPVIAGGHCNRHHWRWRRHGHPLGGGTPRAKRGSRRDAICAIDDCTGRVLARGWCNKHYQRWAKHGDPCIVKVEQLKGVPAEERFWARVDRRHDDECWPWQGKLNSLGYASLSVDGWTVMAHRFAWELLVGPIPDGLTIDHRCFNRACCNPHHMDVVSQAENNRRAARIRWGRTAFS